LYLNFSGIIGELHNYRAGLDAHCQTCFDYFCDIYADYLPQGIKEQLDAKSGAVEQLEYLFTECNKTEQKIYLFIDEYDHFTNAILSDAESLHRYTEGDAQGRISACILQQDKIRYLFQHQTLFHYRSQSCDDGCGCF